MICGKPQCSISREEIIKQVSEADILGTYLGINKIPCLINSPLRVDDAKPSFGINVTPDGSVYYKDFSTGETGGTMKLLMKLWNCDRVEVYKRIQKDLLSFNNKVECEYRMNNNTVNINKEPSELRVRVKAWDKNSIDYWKQFGIDLDTLKRANIYPISHHFIIKGDKTYTFKSDHIAFAFVEYKEGKYTYKIYQPYNKKGYKWTNNHPKDTLGLYRLLPETGESLCICSSVKDSLCLYCALGIPTVSLQGEGMGLSNTVITEFKQRFHNVYILLDSDEAGIKDAKKLADATNFINIQMEPNPHYKDIAEAYQYLGREVFMYKFSQLFEESKDLWLNTLPF